MLDKTGETTPPNAQCLVMRSAGLPGLVVADSAASAAHNADDPIMVPGRVPGRA
jgi:hypothetical protein